MFQMKYQEDKLENFQNLKVWLSILWTQWIKLGDSWTIFISRPFDLFWFHWKASISTCYSTYNWWIKYVFTTDPMEAIESPTRWMISSYLKRTQPEKHGWRSCIPVFFNENSVTATQDTVLNRTIMKNRFLTEIMLLQTMP